MRIQHNIQAMNAYRNYNNNTKALAKNLEKLSSGYRINRAGDDAAGLAISEKMRAQITGLEVAQKNAKDGISLVQTAEGAMTEVHDMLNRMYELAEQSSNGTYADAVDREQMQKEIKSLSDEINRIADSTNFNGIKLMDGSLSKSGFGAGTLPEIGETLGKNTVLHKDAGTPAENTSFSVDLHNLSFSNKAGESFTLSIGGQEFTYETAAAADTTNGVQAPGTPMSAADIAKAFKADKFTVNGAAMTGSQATINGETFDITVSGTRINFTGTTGASVKGDMAVEVKGVPKEATKAAVIDTSATPTYTADTYRDGNNTDAARIALDFTGLSITTGGMVRVGIGTSSFEFEVKDGDDATKIATAFKAAFDASPIKDKDAGTFTSTITGNKVTLNGGNSKPMDDTGLIGGADGNFTFAAVAAQPAGSNPISGDYNVSTTNIVNKGDTSGTRLASTYFNLTRENVKDGQALTIGKETYIFKTSNDSDVTADATKGQKLVDVSDLNVSDENYLSDVATRLTEQAAGNTTYTVGHDDDTDGKVTITENEAQTDYELTSLDAILDTLKFESSTGDVNGLVLQIGDTSDNFNKMTVSINDMHTVAMGIGDIDISTQKGASDAMKKIQDAINYVSDTRGDLGSLQNRLDHTISNLSAMHENIQDAEATIRDVDVAEEMMAYTKNNILVQSAQAMLAQANQLPQGVLQLLQ